MASSKEIRSQIQRDRAADALAKAYSVSVQFCKCACVDYQPRPDHDPPHRNYTPGFQKGDFIHVKEEYNDDWWIGRVVGPENQVVFLPREEKLKVIICETLKIEQGTVYVDAPIMRPIVFLGPSKKSSKLSQFLQIPLVTFMKDKFADRLTTISDHPLDNEKSVHSLEARVHQAGRSLNLVYLDCPVSFPGELDSASRLHPLFIHVQVTRHTVLHQLIRQLTTSSRDRGEMLDSADQLARNSHQCDLLINESNLEDACQKLELFLEGYWAFTRSIFLT